MNITIRKLTTIEEIRLIQPLEQKVWGTNSIPIPTHQTFTAAKNGGLVIRGFLRG